jgi:hypothetical protein
MSLLAVASILLASSSAQPAPTADMPIINPKAAQPANCPATSRYEASRRGKSPKAQRLGELPDADAYKAVYRKIGRCEAPIVVKYGVAGR